MIVIHVSLYFNFQYLGSLSYTLSAVKQEPLSLTPTQLNNSATVFTEQFKISASLGKPKFLVLGFLALVPFAKNPKTKNFGFPKLAEFFSSFVVFPYLFCIFQGH